MEGARSRSRRELGWCVLILENSTRDEVKGRGVGDLQEGGFKEPEAAVNAVTRIWRPCPNTKIVTVVRSSPPSRDYQILHFLSVTVDLPEELPNALRII